jgi:hypothetical protein
MQDEPTGYQVVVVRDSDGQIVHTHQVFYFDGAQLPGEDDLSQEAIAAARNAHPVQLGELTPTVSSRDGLEAMLRESLDRETVTAP